MGLTIEHLETPPKSGLTRQRGPALIYLRADGPTITRDLVTLFKSECEALLPEIFERASLHHATKVDWYPGVDGSWVCLTTDEEAGYDVRVIIGPDRG